MPRCAAVVLLSVIGMSVLGAAPALAAAPSWDVTGRWTGVTGDLSLTQTAGTVGGTFQMKVGCTQLYTVSGSISGSNVSLALRRADGGGDVMPCAGSQTMDGTVDPTGTAMSLNLVNFAGSSPSGRFTGTARALSAAPTTTTAVPDRTTSYSVLVVCSRQRQVCSKTFTTAVQAPKGSLVITFITSAGHCSDVRITISVDGGTPRRSGFIARSTSTPTYVFAVQAGRHQVQIGAEGRPGGCNHGYLYKWAGTLRVRTGG